MSKDHLKPAFEPLARPGAVVTLGQARFTVLKSRLIRMEFDPKGVFEDRPSQVFWYRKQPVPEFSHKLVGGNLTIETDHLLLKYPRRAGGFTPDSLSIFIKEKNHLWRYGDEPTGRLPGTTRTLDRISGKTNLEDSLISRAGWSVVNDTSSLVFNDEGWLERRKASPESVDLYFLGYGMDYQGCLQDFADISGPQGMLPRWALGNWWSRYWAYSHEELLQLMKEFQTHQIPLSVCMVDMDWHITETGNACSGWTGYTWNRKLFPHPEAFLAEMHALGLKVSLNLHPAEGVHPHEEAYAEMARRLGVLPDSREPLPFDITDPGSAQAYLELLHHPLEDMGVDFWWIDWQQGRRAKIKGLDPLWWLNHLHYLDSGRDAARRPIILSRWGGLGCHRYPLGFSGDTVVSWESLAFQPYFTSSAASVGFGWWSHDIGGHMHGREDPELYARWMQFGVFSPILRLHSTKSMFQDRLPWRFDANILGVTRKAMQLRQALIPYLYTMAWKSHAENICLVRPMYHTHAEHGEAYQCPQQYWFGSELVAAPFASPMDSYTRLSRQRVWLPEGIWFDFFTGECYQGDRWLSIFGDLGAIPVFARAGAIVPMSSTIEWPLTGNPEELEIHIFAGGNNRFLLYEDDGITQYYQQGKYCLTEFEVNQESDRLEFILKKPQGDVSHIPANRSYRLHFHGVRRPQATHLLASDQAVSLEWQYDASTETLTIDSMPFDPGTQATVLIYGDPGGLLSQRDRTKEKVFAMLERFSLDTRIKERIFEHLEEIRGNAAELNRFAKKLKSSQLRALKEVLFTS